MLLGLAAIQGVKHDQQNGYLKGLVLQTYKTTTTTVKHVTDDSSASTAILTTTAEIKGAISSLSAKYGLDETQMMNTISCESGFQSDPPHNNESRGVAQFMPETWKLCSDKDDRTDAYKSLSCMAKLFSENKKYLWDCYCLKYYDDKCILFRGIYPIDYKK